VPAVVATERAQSRRSRQRALRSGFASAVPLHAGEAAPLHARDVPVSSASI
jgi:hypothetical protein